MLLPKSTILSPGLIRTPPIIRNSLNPLNSMVHNPIFLIGSLQGEVDNRGEEDEGVVKGQGGIRVRHRLNASHATNSTSQRGLTILTYSLTSRYMYASYAICALIVWSVYN